MSLSVLGSLLSFFLKFAQEALFGKTAFADVVRRNKVASTFAVLTILMFCLFVYVTDQAMRRTVELTTQIKLTNELQKNFEFMVPPGTPPSEAPRIIIKTLLKNEYEYKQCRQEVTILRSLLEETATQETSTNLQNLLQKLREGDASKSLQH